MNLFPFLAKYRVHILILSMIADLLSLFYRIDSYIPGIGLILFFLPTITSLRNTKKLYHVKVITLISISYLICAYTIINTHIYNSLQNKVIETSLVHSLLLTLGLSIFFILVALAFGIIWNSTIKNKK